MSDIKNVRGANCRGCPLFDNKYTLVLPKGPRQPDFIVVGEGPGKDEAYVKRNFVGQSGDILRQTLKHNGLDPDRGYYANVSLCWPRGLDNKEKVMPQVVLACQNEVYKLLRVLPDVPVLVLGEWAQRSLGLSVAERWERTKLSGGKWSLGAKHPAAAIYEPTLMFQIAQAIKKFSLASTPDDVYYQYPGKMVYVENPYPLPDLNRWGGQLICVDIETDNGVSWRDPDNHIFLLGIGVGSEFYILTREYLNQPETHAWLRALFVQHGHNIGGHNFKFDLLKLAQEFGVPLVIGWDTILMVNVYHESWHKGLKELATWFYNADDYEERLVKNYLRTKYKKPT